MDISVISEFIKEYGLPTALVIWFMYYTSTNGKAQINRVDNLNSIVSTWSERMSKNMNNLIKQNNFMLHALSNMIMGHQDAAKDMINQAIVELDKDEDGEKN